MNARVRAAEPEDAATPGGLTVRAAAERLGVTPRTLKYYEELGLVLPARSQGRYRIYDEEALARIDRILQLRSIGFSLQAITEFMKRPLEAAQNGKMQLSSRSLQSIRGALRDQLHTVDLRIAAVRRELNETLAVRKQLEADLAYVDGRLAGEPIDALLEQRRKHSK
jgi:DNA-binding transcriptional MerR regulator